MNHRDERYKALIETYGKDAQRTDDWYAKRSEMITASEVYKIFSTPEGRREILERKIAPASSSSGSSYIPALVWGTRFEEVAKQLFEETTDCSVTDIGCVTHPECSYLGASPDGLIGSEDPERHGRLVEFKCPISREEKDEIPIAYWHQMQMQMECTGIDECEYVEFRFKQVNYTEWKRSSAEHKGAFVVYEDGRVDYTKSDTGGADDCQVVYWTLKSMKKDLVKRDPNWYSDHKEQLDAFWKEVLEARTKGVSPTKPTYTLSFDI